MSRPSFHDVIIVGSSPAALMTADLLCRMDYRVLVIGQGQHGGTYNDHGIRLQARPFILPPYGHSKVLDEVLKDMGIEDPVHVVGEDHEPPIQLVTPDQRIDLFSSPSALSSEIKRAFPKQADHCTEIIGELRGLDERFRQVLSGKPRLPPKSIRERSGMKRALGELGAHELPPVQQWPLVMRILVAAVSFYSRLDEKMRPPFVTGHAVLGLLGGLRTVPDFDRLLEQAVEKNGGEIEKKIVADQIHMEKRRAVGIQTLRGEKTYGCKALVSSLSIDQTLDLIPLGRRHKRLLAASSSVRQSAGLFVVNLILPSEILPLGMGKQLFVVRNPDEPLIEGNLIRVHCSRLEERIGRAVVNLSCVIPYRKRTLGREYLGPLQKQLLDTAEWLIPFMNEHLQNQSSPFWKGRSGDEPHPAPWSIHPIFETERAIDLGCSILGTETPYKNLFYCGPEAMPGLGQEGAAYAAVQVAEAVCEQVKLKRLL